MDKLLSPKQVAAAIGASESSLKRWCDQGRIVTVKTAGGHRRITIQEVLRFIRSQDLAIVEPHLLSLPSTNDRKGRSIEGNTERLTTALLEGNESACQAIVIDLFLSGEPLSRIFDDVVAPAFRTIGERWECHEAEVYQERSACWIMARLLYELRSKQVAPRSKCSAMGATIEGDQYMLPVTMAELVLRSLDWDAQLLGTSIPFSSLEKAIERCSPRLVWLSVSAIDDEQKFIRGFDRLVALAAETQTAIVVGGRALKPEIRSRLAYSAFCDTMRHLEEFAKSLRRDLNSTSKKSKKK